MLTDFYFHVLEVLSYVEARLFVEGIPSKSTISLNYGDFKLAGEVMAMSIVQHGKHQTFCQLRSMHILVEIFKYKT